MQMSENEILTDYKNALNPAHQIKVLAQLNACHTDKIKDILIRKGALVTASANNGEAAQTGGAPTDAAENKENGKPSGEGEGVKAVQAANAKFDYDVAMKLYKEGKNDAEIASLIGAKSKSSIARWRKINNLLPQSSRSAEADGSRISSVKKKPVQKNNLGWQERFAAVLSTASPDDSLSVRTAYRDLLAAIAPFEFGKALGVDDIQL